MSDKQQKGNLGESIYKCGKQGLIITFSTDFAFNVAIAAAVAVGTGEAAVPLNMIIGGATTRAAISAALSIGSCSLMAIGEHYFDTDNSTIFSTILRATGGSIKHSTLFYIDKNPFDPLVTLRGFFSGLLYSKYGTDMAVPIEIVDVFLASRSVAGCFKGFIKGSIMSNTKHNYYDPASKAIDDVVETVSGVVSYLIGEDSADL